MLDFGHIGKYRENNRIEAKTALGGLPKSIWETYSAFANTLGGIILLGVTERKDGTFAAVDLPDPHGLVEEFWTLVNKKEKANVNILPRNNIYVELVRGKHIVVIEVPRAHRSLRPIYVDGNPQNSYIRSGEGDYKCTPEEYRALIRDAEKKTQDMTALDEPGLSALNPKTLRRYRKLMTETRPGHPWEKLTRKEFLIELGAAVTVPGQGELHLTRAGLLMFGKWKCIKEVYPHFDLAVENSLGENPGRNIKHYRKNIFDFYTALVNEAAEKHTGPDQISHADFKKAFGEATTNCLVNADYCRKPGVAIKFADSHIALSNPGNFRLDVDTAKGGGISDPRNSTILKMFHLVSSDERGTGGLRDIINIWHKGKLPEPEIIETAKPASTLVILPLTKEAADYPRPGKAQGSADTHLSDAWLFLAKDLIVDYLTDNPGAAVRDISHGTGITEDVAKQLLDELLSLGLLAEAEGLYNLKR